MSSYIWIIYQATCWCIIYFIATGFYHKTMRICVFVVQFREPICCICRINYILHSHKEKKREDWSEKAIWADHNFHFKQLSIFAGLDTLSFSIRSRMGLYFCGSSQIRTYCAYLTRISQLACDNITIKLTSPLFCKQINRNDCVFATIIRIKQKWIHWIFNELARTFQKNKLFKFMIITLSPKVPLKFPKRNI